MRLYLSGGMTGYENHNFPRFNEVTARLEALGYEVENPASKGEISGWEWSDYMRYDIARIVGDYSTGQRIGGVDGIATLENWRRSKGARREVSLGKTIDIPIFPFQKWLREAAMQQFNESEKVSV